MLSYKHHYHAGNFADVHKHLALITTLTALGRKKTAYTVLDTHAGGGCYDLQALSEKHTTEYRSGIARLWALRDCPPSGSTAIAPLATYLNLLQTLNPDQQLRYYPGSPVISQYLLRPQDHLQLLELHPSEYQTLKQRMHKKRQISVHQRDAYEGLVALSPPKEKRGLVLIDPSYEIKNEPAQLLEALHKAWQRWRNGVYLIWYPLLPNKLHEHLLKGLMAGLFAPLWHCELEIKRPQSQYGLYGSGLVLLNPPWQVPEQLTELLPRLADWLSQDASIWRQKWLRSLT